MKRHREVLEKQNKTKQKSESKNKTFGASLGKLGLPLVFVFAKNKIYD